MDFTSSKVATEIGDTLPLVTFKY